MKIRPVILRSAAFLLILVFSQRSGAGLIFHSLMHPAKANNGIPSNNDEKKNDLSYACNCADDFLMPFAESDTVFDLNTIFFIVIYQSIFDFHIPYHNSVFSFLRGPPIDLA